MCVVGHCVFKTKCMTKMEDFKGVLVHGKCRTCFTWRASKEISAHDFSSKEASVRDYSVTRMAAIHQRAFSRMTSRSRVKR